MAAALVGIKESQVPTIVESIRRGLIEENRRSIRLVGDPVALPRVSFHLPPRARDVDLLKANTRGRLSGWLLGAVNRQLRPCPGFSPEMCLGCGECSRVCPPKAITMEGQMPRVDLERCIRCFCCQELCPQKAVQISRPWLGRLLFK